MREQEAKQACVNLGGFSGVEFDWFYKGVKYMQEKCKNQWIDIKEEQPKFDRTLDCIAKGTGRRVLDIYYNEEDLPLELFYTHWMYSPEPPTSQPTSRP